MSVVSFSFLKVAPVSLIFEHYLQKHSRLKKFASDLASFEELGCGR